MKKLLCFLLITTSLFSCKKDPSALLIGRWDFMKLEMPGMYDLISDIKYTGDNDETAMQRFLLGNKLVLRKDSTFDLVMLKQYIHGTWAYDKTSQNLFLKDASSAKFDLTVRIDSITSNKLIFDIDQFTLNKFIDKHAAENNFYHMLMNKSYCQFYLTIDKDRYSNLEEDPYSIENNKWRVQPAKAESNNEIKQRVLNHLTFWQNLFADAQEFDKAYISYNWFDSPLIIASNGVQLEYYNQHKLEWDQNFYDSAQANKGYQMMRQCFNKKIDFMQTDNKYRKQEDVIQQLKTNYLEGNKHIK